MFTYTKTYYKHFKLFTSKLNDSIFISFKVYINTLSQIINIKNIFQGWTYNLHIVCKKKKKKKKLTSIMFYMVAWDYKTTKMLLQVHDAIKQHFKTVAKERVV